MKEAFYRVLSFILILGKHLISMFVRRRQDEMKDDDDQSVK